MNILSKLFPKGKNETTENYKQRFKLKFFIWLSFCLGLWAVFNQVALWTTRSQLNDVMTDHSNSLSTIEFMKKKIQKDSSTIYLQEVQKTDERTAKIHAQADAAKFKKLYLSVKGKVTAGIKDVSVPINSDPTHITPLTDSTHQCDSLLQLVYNKCDSLLAEQVSPGSTFYKDSKWFYTGGRIYRDSLQIDSIGFKPGRIGFIYGQTGGFFKKKRDTSQISFENPYITLTDMSSVAVVDLRPKPKRIVWMIAGVLIGGVTTFLLVK